MAVLDFMPNYTTDEICVGGDMELCLTDKLEDMDDAIAGKAAVGHVHGGYAPTNHEHEGYASANHEHEGYATEDHTHMDYAMAEHTHSGYASENHSHSEYASANHEHSEYAANDHTHTGFANEEHNHDADYIKKAFQIVSDTGSFKYSFKTTDNVNLLDEIKVLPTGVCTIYAQSGVSGNPKTVEAWRMLAHKTGDTVIWVIAFGSFGSVYTNYCTDGTWQGWCCIFDAAPAALWTGGYYMHGNQTIYPSKPLSKCKNGWMLVWSNYDTTIGAPTDGDIVFSYIPKRCYDGNEWSGHSHLISIPIDTAAHCIKKLYVWNDRLVGNAVNNQDTRSNVVLRAVYEF